MSPRFAALVGLALLAAAPRLARAAGPGAGTDAGTPDAGTPKGAPLLPVDPPLGRIGDVLQPPPPGGIPADETVVVARFSGCEKPQAIFLGRFLLLGAAVAGETLQQWLDAQPRVQRELFGKKRPLVEAVRKAREGSHFEGRACTPRPGGAFDYPTSSRDGRLWLPAAPAALCKLERGPVEQGGEWLFARSSAGAVKQRQFTGMVALTPPEEGAKNRCLPLLSAALFDERGVTRLRYHADYNGSVEVELVGDGCRSIRFGFDPIEQRFLPRREQTPNCRGKGWK